MHGEKIKNSLYTKLS